MFCSSSNLNSTFLKESASRAESNGQTAGRKTEGRACHQLLVEWNDTRAEYPQVRIADLVEAQAARTPDALALRCAGHSLTYRELNERANQLAHYLAGRGVGPDVRVGVTLNRSVNMVVALLGILKAGGAYVPLDYTFPRERLAFLIQDTALPLLLTETALQSCLPAPAGAVLCLDAEWETITRASATNLERRGCPDDLAYVLYTSGSTGQPKGVPVVNREVVNLFQFMRERPGMTERDVVLASTILSFDIAAVEMLLPLTVGACVVMVGREAATDGNLLLRTLSEVDITIMQATPFTWRLLVEAGWQAGLSLQKAFCGGEALPRPLANAILDRVPEHWNLYGPTETTIWSTFHRVTSREGPVSIGRPVANTQIHLLDEHLQSVPLGAIGEIYIGGVGLARGYLNRPDLTRERFLADPFRDEQGARLYKTGDLARYHPDGDIEYLGRADHQVKIRGFRMELGEIEARLMAHGGVRAAVVSAVDTPAGEKGLAAHVVAYDRPTPSAAELRQFLAGQLPSYMVPISYTFLDALPQTPNGKVDRKALPAPQWHSLGQTEQAEELHTDTERKLQKLWEEVLGIPVASRTSHFFELGGDSLSALRLFGRIQEAFGRFVPVSLLHEQSTLEGLAHYLDERTASQPARGLVPLEKTGKGRPLFLFHGIGGPVLNYKPLASRLGVDRPVYGLRAIGLPGEGEPLTSVPALAQRYREEILGQGFRGPFLLAGWSFGAHVAYETAQQLLAQGHRVGLLAILDEPALPSPSFAARSLALLPNVIRNLSYLYQNDAAFRQSFLRRILPLMGKGAGILKQKMVRRAAYLFGRKPPQGNMAAYYGFDKLPEVYHPIIRANIRAESSYLPRAYPGPIALLRASVRLTGNLPPDLGWGKLAAGGVSIHPVSGDHTEMLAEPHATVLAEKLRACLDQACSVET